MLGTKVPIFLQSCIDPGATKKRNCSACRIGSLSEEGKKASEAKDETPEKADVFGTGECTLEDLHMM